MSWLVEMQSNEKQRVKGVYACGLWAPLLLLTPPQCPQITLTGKWGGHGRALAYVTQTQDQETITVQEVQSPAFGTERLGLPARCPCSGSAGC